MTHYHGTLTENKAEIIGFTIRSINTLINFSDILCRCMGSRSDIKINKSVKTNPANVDGIKVNRNLFKIYTLEASIGVPDFHDSVKYFTGLNKKIASVERSNFRFSFISPVCDLNNFTID